VLDDWCLELGRDPEHIERSSGANPHRPESGAAFVAAGANLLTLGIDGRSAYDLAPVAEWLAWRDEVNRAG
jgi:hypothetical protein